MYEILFYENKRGNSEILEYMRFLQENTCKENRMKSKKIASLLDLLKVKGLSLGEPYLKHLREEIWELRPLKDRILLASVKYHRIILLTIFRKETKKTPESEILRVKMALIDFLERTDENEKA